MLTKVWPVEETPFSPIHHFFLWHQSISHNSIQEYLPLLNRNTWMIGFCVDYQYAESFFVGEAVPHFHAKLPESPWILGVAFRAGRYPQVTHCKMAQVSEQVLPLENHVETSTISLLGELSGNSHWESKIDHLYNFLLSDTQPYDGLEWVLKAIELIRLGQLQTVEELARELGVGRRKLERLFHSFIGLSPKYYVQLERFRRAVQLLQRYPEMSQSDLVEQGGYYDQAHLIRQFKTFSGLTPRQFRKKIRRPLVVKNI